MKLKRPANVPAITSDDPQTAAYVHGRQEWNEQVGGLVSARDSWRLAAIGCIGVALLSVAGGIYDHQQNHTHAYVVEMDKLGDNIAVSRLDETPPVNDRLIRHDLAAWVVNVRSVYTDVKAEKNAIISAFSFVDGQSSASNTLKQWWSEHEPFGRAKDEVVEVAVRSVQPISANVWRVEWCEDVHPRQSPGLACEARGSRHGAEWLATVTVSVNPPDDDEGILKNPSGLFLENYTWSERSEQHS